MSPFNRRLLLLAALALAPLLGGCQRPAGDPGHRLVVAATPVPHGEILRSVKRTLAKQGIDLVIRPVDDYETPNDEVRLGIADLNYVQTQPNLARYNAVHHANLVEVAAIHSEPLAAYSKRVNAVARLPDSATVGLPNEPSTVSRALLLMQRGGLIMLAPGKGGQATIADVAGNPRKLRFVTAPPGAAATLLSRADLVFVNTNFALAAGLDPARDALLIEGANSPYVNILAGRPGAADDERVKALVAALRDPATRAFMQKRYKGAVVPAP